MNRYLSKKIKIISMLSIFAVILIHSYNFKDTFLTPTTRITEGLNPFAMTEYFVSNGVTRFAVPLFFIISGYLFYRNFDGTAKDYGRKLKKRFGSLLIPYLIWTAISIGIILFCYYVIKAKDLPTVKSNMELIFAKNPVLLYNPPAFQLWYMRELIIYTLLAPVIYFLVKKTKLVFLIILAVLWVTDFYLILNSEGLLFYCLGAYIGIFKLEEKTALKRTKKSVVLLFGLVFIIICLAKTFLAAILPQGIIYDFALILPHKIAILFGIYFIWYGFDHIFKDIENKKQLLRFARSSFMFYVLHEPLLHLCYEQIVKADSSGFYHLFMYIILPTCTVAVAYIFDIYLCKLLKPVHKVLTGGR